MKKKTIGIVIAGVILLVAGFIFFFANRPSESLRRKAETMQQEVPQWGATHPESQAKIEGLLDRFDTALEREDYAEAERLANEILTMMGLPTQ